ncbi:MAG: enoyl-CoA hydratase/isomerase family protein [Fastidiosipilaceae bacterium]|jgi:enoyl-CoA hydratase
MQFNKISIIDGYELQKVRFSVANHVGLITLHNPPVNALDGIVQEEILRLCAHLFSNQDIWVCVMHSDLKTFCVGVDVNRFKQSVVDRNVSDVQEVFYDGALALYNLPIPLICAVHGHCLGGGLCYPAGSDIVIAAEGTLFGIPEVNLSVTGGSGHLSRVLPPLVMRDLAYTGEFISAEKLLSFGGVTQVVPLDTLLETAIRKAETLCSKGPLVLRELKACMNSQENFEMKRKNDLEITHTRYMARSEDFGEALSAFLEKRKPNLKGK